MSIFPKTNFLERSCLTDTFQIRQNFYSRANSGHSLLLNTHFNCVLKVSNWNTFKSFIDESSSVSIIEPPWRQSQMSHPTNRGITHHFPITHSFIKIFEVKSSCLLNVVQHFREIKFYKRSLFRTQVCI